MKEKCNPFLGKKKSKYDIKCVTYARELIERRCAWPPARLRSSNSGRVDDSLFLAATGLQVFNSRVSVKVVFKFPNLALVQHH